MKRAKVMLSAILIMAIVAGALAFKVKSPEVCAYSKELTGSCPTTTQCDRVGASTTFGATSTTTIANACKYATTIGIEVGVPCPEATAVCTRSRTLQIEPQN